MKLLICISLLLSISFARSPDPTMTKTQENLVNEHYKDKQHHDRVDHESVLGSSDAAEEYEHLPPEEAKKRLGILVERMDLDKDGFVTYEELTDWIQESLRQLDEEEVRERFPNIDLDKDGKVNWEEYLNDAFGEDWKNDKESAEFMKEDERYFKAADRDLDGKLTPQEFAGFQRPENHVHMADALVKLTMDERDHNKDGILTYEEYMSAIGADADKEWRDIEKERFETEYDTNKDGKLDNAEIHAWLAPDSKEAAREEAAHLIKETDKDKDQKLSYREIIEQHELWVGSEATAYGEHLNKMEL